MTEKLFLIRKRGFYYRPNAQGYTVITRDAGRFTEAEAIAHRDSCDPGEITLVEAPEEVRKTIPEDIRRDAEAALAWRGSADDVYHVGVAILAERERCAVIVERGLGRTNTTIARMIREGGKG